MHLTPSSYQQAYRLTAFRWRNLSIDLSVHLSLYPYIDFVSSLILTAFSCRNALPSYPPHYNHPLLNSLLMLIIFLLVSVYLALSFFFALFFSFFSFFFVFLVISFLPAGCTYSCDLGPL
uniref:Uncharacterized protein n=1 Tax=Picea glauca TaxID=3330 RepID=A0A117NH11_PICGL|nr:hypothetical protein ABT39_MTgene5832 [Picea glauca]